MLKRIRALAGRAQGLRQVASLSDRALADAGLSRDQAEAFVSMPRDVPERVAAMARLFGLGAGEVMADRASHIQLLLTCAECLDRAACRQVLDRGPLSRPRDADFCLNKRRFARRAG